MKRIVLIFTLISSVICAHAAQKSSAQDVALFRFSRRAVEGIKGGFFSGAAGYVWHRMALGNPNPVVKGLCLGTGALTGFFGNWARAKRVYDEKKLERSIVPTATEKIDNTVFGMYTGGIAASIAARYAQAKKLVTNPLAHRYGGLAGAGLGFLYHLMQK